MALEEHGEDLLADYEVYNVLSEYDGDEYRGRKSRDSLENIHNDVRNYLNKKPCIDQTSDKIVKLLESLNEFPIHLTRYEKLMIINTPPRSQLQLSLLVKDCEERFDEEQMNTLLAVINICLPLAQKQV